MAGLGAGAGPGRGIVTGSEDREVDLVGFCDGCEDREVDLVRFCDCLEDREVGKGDKVKDPRICRQNRWLERPVGRTPTRITRQFRGS